MIAGGCNDLTSLVLYHEIDSNASINLCKQRNLYIYSLKMVEDMNIM